MNKTNKFLTTRTTCRLCDSQNVAVIYPFPHCPPVDNYRFADEPEVNYPAFPMDLYQCSDCGHAQLLDIVSPDVLFGNYIYTSSSSPDLDLHFEQYAEKMISTIALSTKDLIVDVGSNDGLFLSKFKKRGLNVLGVDASEYASNVAIKENGIPTINAFFSQEIAENIVQEHGHAKLITANNVFSHSDDLRGFAQTAKSLLKPDGLFVFEVSYLLDLVEKRVVDYVYHEHLAHHSIKPFDLFFKSIGMKLVDVDRIATKGGSIRCYAAHEDSHWARAPIVDQLMAKEEHLGLYNKETYRRLKVDIDALAKQTHDYLAKNKSQGFSAASYGASATATVLTYMFDINQYFSFIVDDNPLLQGRVSPGHQIPVKSRDELLTAKPDVVVISAWRFAEMIIAANQAYLNQGGKFIIPMPEFKIISKG